MNTAERVEALVKEPVEAAGFALADVEFVKEYGNWVLTLYIDKPDGVTIDDCERVSKLVDPILDEADPVEQSYYLSVSSLGLDRPLKKDADYARNLGREITVKLYAPMDGTKEFSGKLTTFDTDALTLDVNGTPLRILRKDAASVKPVIVF